MKLKMKLKIKSKIFIYKPNTQTVYKPAFHPSGAKAFAFASATK